MKIERVAVIGGGIGGLASAILLSRAGVEVTIYEQSEKAEPVGAGFLLQPPGQIVLDHIGVLEEINKKSVPITKLKSKNSSGKLILDLDYSDLSGSTRHGLGVQRSTIYDALYGVAIKEKGINFKWDSKVESCDADGDSASVFVNDTKQRFDLCILSSGANSDLADKLFPNRISSTYNWGCMWTTFVLPAGLSPDTLHQRCRRSSNMMGILPVLRKGSEYEAALYWSVEVNRMSELNENNVDSFKRNLIKFWPETEYSIDPLTYNDFIPARYRDVWTPKPFNKNIVAIGDVSHATSPQLGQGCTMALLDAYLLVENMLCHSNVDHAVEQWWNGRRKQLMYVRYLSRFLTPLYQSDKNIFSLFRDLVMAPMGRAPLFYSLQLKTLASEVLIDSGIKDRFN